MDLVDTNFWLSLTIEAHPHHEIARKWFEKTGRKRQLVFNRATQQSYLRLLTQPLGHGYEPCAMTDAWNYYDQLLQDTRIFWVAEPTGMEGVWRSMTDKKRASPKLWMDAYLAAFAVSCGYRFVTFDAGFKHFKNKGLQLHLLSN